MSFLSQNTSKSMSAGASPQTPLGELIALPRPLTGFKAASRHEGNGGEGREGLGREKRGREGQWEWGREGKGEVGG